MVELLNGYVTAPEITENIDEYIVLPGLGRQGRRTGGNGGGGGKTTKVRTYWKTIFDT